jgi:membrane fusion protein, heavy metal efflux system
MSDQTKNHDADTNPPHRGPREDAGAVEVERVTEVTEHAGGDRTRVEVEAVRAEPSSRRRRNVAVLATVAIVAVFALVSLLLWRGGGTPASTEVKVNAEAGEAKHGAEYGGGEEVMLTPEAREAAGLEIEGVTERPAVALLRVTGTVETNQQQTQQATPLVGGRVERVNVVLGDTVRAGQVLAVISSPQIAQMHGKLHEAETARALAERNLERVMRSENRVAVLQAKAKLDEADATLRRTRRLIELGAGAGKDLIAAEAAYKTAKAEYDFQSNITLNREVQEARAAVETARVDVAHIRDEMRSLGLDVPEGEGDDNHSRNTSLVAVLAPVSGAVTERLVNAGAGVEPGTALFTIANTSTVWVIANVPEAQLGLLRPGTPAEVRSAALGEGAFAGRVNYIDPRLNEETRTGKVRVELANPGGRLKAGMFVEVGFQAGTGAGEGQELVVREEAVQRVGERTVVFVPKEDEENGFEVREIQAGGVRDGYARVLGGLKLGEKVVTKGSFTLKAQMQKGEMGDHDH